MICEIYKIRNEVFFFNSMTCDFTNLQKGENLSMVLTVIFEKAKIVHSCKQTATCYKKMILFDI